MFLIWGIFAGQKLGYQIVTEEKKQQENAFLIVRLSDGQMLTEIATFLWDAKFIFCRIGSIEICNPRNLACCLYIQRKGGLFSDILSFEAYFRFLDFKGSFLSLIFEFWKFRKLFWNQWAYLGRVCFLTFCDLRLILGFWILRGNFLVLIF